MADVNRKTVSVLVLHHAVTPTWENKSRGELAQWFSDNGFKRAYGSNAANWSGLINPYTGGRSYSQAHFAGQRVDGSTPDATDAERKAGYRLVALVSDPWGQITWHAGNWDTNTKSIGIENLGDYRYITLRENDCKVIADFWRGQDRALGGRTVINGHLEVSDSSTACPAQIMNSRQRIVDLVNAPNSGWPVDPPVTTTTSTTTTTTTPAPTTTTTSTTTSTTTETPSTTTSTTTTTTTSGGTVAPDWLKKLLEIIWEIIQKIQGAFKK